MTIKNATEYMTLVENRLGWQPPGRRGSLRYNVEVSRVKERLQANPDLFTWRNLELAVELCRRERLPRTPLGVLAHVQRAVDMRKDDLDDLEVEIWQAMSKEIANDDPDGWATRFARAQGIHRQQLLHEWKETRA